ncbi:hypothetical protein G9A89_011994 [Geosiphon pyriformis]|nr:hypothetical protein G9A89_011994 [Geosiphon pyriformis]
MKNPITVSLSIDLIPDIVIHLRNDFPSLFSCMLVNRTWYRFVAPILWHDPFSLDTLPHQCVILDTIISCFTKEQQQDISEYGKILELPPICHIKPSPTLPYLLYIRCLDDRNVFMTVIKWCQYYNLKITDGEIGLLFLLFFKNILYDIRRLDSLGMLPSYYALKVYYDYPTQADDDFSLTRFLEIITEKHSSIRQFRLYLGILEMFPETEATNYKNLMVDFMKSQKKLEMVTFLEEKASANMLLRLNSGGLPANLKILRFVECYLRDFTVGDTGRILAKLKQTKTKTLSFSTTKTNQMQYCSRPFCNKPSYIEQNGKFYPFCSKICAFIFQEKIKLPRCANVVLELNKFISTTWWEMEKRISH